MIFFNEINASCTNYFLTTPFNSDSTNSTIKIKKKIFAIPAAVPAIPPNPRIPAIIAMIMNVMVQRNIMFCFKWFDIQVLSALKLALMIRDLFSISAVIFF